MATGDETRAGPRPELPPRQQPAPRPDASVTGRPQILAPQANDWDDARQEVQSVKRRGPGPILLFLLAGLVVAVIALGLAAWSVFRGGDETATGGGADTTLGPEGTDTLDPNTATTLDPNTTITTAPAVDPNALQVVLTEEPFICDGATRQFGTISGADPNEEIAFTSPQADALKSGTADATGSLPIRWQCDPEQAGTTWELTATGAVSGRTATFLFAGVNAADGGTSPSSDPASTDATAATGPAPTTLTVNIIENPFKCDGGSRIFGGLSGADPNEEVAFTSPQASGISNGMADANGELQIRWSCDDTQVGTTWELTATGVTSGRAVTFSFTGS